MALGAPGLLEAVAGAKSLAGGTKPAAPAEKGRATATTPSCQQQLSSESCPQQPSYPASHLIKSTGSFLPTTALWSKDRHLPHKGKRAMLTTDQINDLHHLYWA